jgi:hypothetical protein
MTGRQNNVNAWRNLRIPVKKLEFHSGKINMIGRPVNGQWVPRVLKLSLLDKESSVLEVSVASAVIYVQVRIDHEGDVLRRGVKPHQLGLDQLVLGLTEAILQLSRVQLSEARIDENLFVSAHKKPSQNHPWNPEP